MPATGLAQARLRALSFTSPLGLPPLLPSPSLAARRGNGHPPHVVLAYRDVEPGVHHGSARSRRGVQSGSPAGVVQRAAVPAAIRVGPPAAAGGGAGGRACRAPAGRELQETAPRSAAAGCRAARCGGVHGSTGCRGHSSWPGSGAWRGTASGRRRPGGRRRRRSRRSEPWHRIPGLHPGGRAREEGQAGRRGWQLRCCNQVRAMR